VAERLETLTLIVAQGDGDTPALVNIPLTIDPLDNCPPQLVIGGHLLADMDTPISLGPDVISARDRDTAPQQLIFHVTQTPRFGRLVKRSTPTSRRGLLNCVCYMVSRKKNSHRFWARCDLQILIFLVNKSGKLLKTVSRVAKKNWHTLFCTP